MGTPTDIHIRYGKDTGCDKHEFMQGKLWKLRSLLLLGQKMAAIRKSNDTVMPHKPNHYTDWN